MHRIAHPIMLEKKAVLALAQTPDQSYQPFVSDNMNREASGVTHELTHRLNLQVAINNPQNCQR